MGARRLKALAVRGTSGIPLADPEAFSDCTLAIAKGMHTPNGCPKWSSLDPNMVPVHVSFVVTESIVIIDSGESLR